MTSPLTARHCVPCGKDAQRVPPAQAEALMAQLPHWEFREDGRRLERDFKFGDFAAAFAFVSRIAHLAEAEGHHPDLAFGWGYVNVSLQTHAIVGLHENDFIMAAHIDALQEKHS